MRQLIYRHFGLPADPWQGHCETADAQRVGWAVEAALAGGALVAVAGPRGTGKTHALWRALAGHDCQVVEPLRLDRERMTIADITAAIVTQLSDETPRHSGEARAGQALRLLRAAERPALVIDEAHLLHHQTVRALKRLRELGGRGSRAGLLPVALAGQADPTARVPEVALRTDLLTLSGLTRKEAAEALRQAMGGAFEAEAVAALAKSPAARNWLDLIRLADDCLALAQAEGAKRVDAALAQRALGKGAGRQAEASLPEAPRDGQVAGILGRERQGRRAAG